MTHASRVAFALAAVLAGGTIGGADARDQGSLRVSPSLLEIDLAPGERALRSIALANSGGATLDVAVRITDWSMSDEGAVSLPARGSTRGSCGAMVRVLPERVLVPAGGRATITLIAESPSTGPPLSGTCWTAVLFQLPEVLTVDEGKPLRLALQLATTVYLTASGSMPPFLRLEETGAAFELEPGATALAATVRNPGPVAARFSIQWLVTDPGGAPVARLERLDQVVLPESKRVFRVLPDPPLPSGTFDVRVLVRTAIEAIEDAARIRVP